MNNLAFAPGDRVRLIGGKHSGSTGVVFGKNGERIKVRSDQHGTIKAFDPLLLEFVPGILPVAEQLTIIDGFTGDPEWMTSPPQEDFNPSRSVDETPASAESPTLMTSPPYSEDLNPSEEMTSTPHDLGAEPLIVLQALRDRVAATALTDCWLESAGGDRVRVQYYKKTGKPAQYIDAKEAVEMRSRIEAGRALKHCDALLRYLGES